MGLGCSGGGLEGELGAGVRLSLWGDIGVGGAVGVVSPYRAGEGIGVGGGCWVWGTMGAEVGVGQWGCGEGWGGSGTCGDTMGDVVGCRGGLKALWG